MLEWTKEWTKWFAHPDTDFGEFIEALAEHPEIDCVDFSRMPKDSAGHKKYLTEDAVQQLLKTYDVLFICRYMPKDVKGSLDNWTTWGKSYNLSFINNKGKVVTAQYVGDKKNEIKKNDGGWLWVKSGDKYVASKTENGKKRLLWNKATMNSIYETFKNPYDYNWQELLDVLSGRFAKEKSKKYQYKNLTNEENKDALLVPYKPIEVIDFTIGNPKDYINVEGKNFYRESIQGSIEKFLEAVISVDDNLRDTWVKQGLRNKLKGDAAEKLDKKSLNYEQRAELQEKLSLMNRLGDKNFKDLIKKWNEKHTKSETRELNWDAICLKDEEDAKNVNIPEDKKRPRKMHNTITDVIKYRQLAENMNFLAQWPLITWQPSKKMKPDDWCLKTLWSESDKEELLSALELERRWVTDLTLEELLQRADAWTEETRKAFVKKWNAKYSKRKISKTQSFTKQLATLDKSKAILGWLRRVELLETLERCSQGDDKKNFIKEWNDEHSSCLLVENLKSVEQAFAISKWENEVKENDKNEKKETDLRPTIRTHLNYIEFLNIINFKKWFLNDSISNIY